MLSKKIIVLEFIIDETLIKIGSELVWLWVAIEPKHRQILQIDISFERTMLVAERFIASLINRYGKHPISTEDGVTWYPPQACHFLKLKHHLHIPLLKALSKEQCNMSRIELNALMTISYAKEKNAS